MLSRIGQLTEAQIIEMCNAGLENFQDHIVAVLKQVLARITPPNQLPAESPLRQCFGNLYRLPRTDAWRDTRQQCAEVLCDFYSGYPSIFVNAIHHDLSEQDESYFEDDLDLLLFCTTNSNDISFTSLSDITLDIIFYIIRCNRQIKYISCMEPLNSHEWRELTSMVQDNNYNIIYRLAKTVAYDSINQFFKDSYNNNFWGINYNTRDFWENNRSTRGKIKVYPPICMHGNWRGFVGIHRELIEHLTVVINSNELLPKGIIDLVLAMREASKMGPDNLELNIDVKLKENENNDFLSIKEHKIIVLSNTLFNFRNIRTFMDLVFMKYNIDFLEFKAMQLTDENVELLCTVLQRHSDFNTEISLVDVSFTSTAGEHKLLAALHDYDALLASVQGMINKTLANNDGLSINQTLSEIAALRDMIMAELAYPECCTLVAVCAELQICIDRLFYSKLSDVHEKNQLEEEANLNITAPIYVTGYETNRVIGLQQYYQTLLNKHAAYHHGYLPSSIQRLLYFSDALVIFVQQPHFSLQGVEVQFSAVLGEVMAPNQFLSEAEEIRLLHLKPIATLRLLRDLLFLAIYHGTRIAEQLIFNHIFTSLDRLNTVKLLPPLNNNPAMKNPVLPAIQFATAVGHYTQSLAQQRLFTPVGGLESKTDNIASDDMSIVAAARFKRKLMETEQKDEKTEDTMEVEQKNMDNDKATDDEESSLSAKYARQ